VDDCASLLEDGVSTGTAEELRTASELPVARVVDVTVCDDDGSIVVCDDDGSTVMRVADGSTVVCVDWLESKLELLSACVDDTLALEGERMIEAEEDLSEG